MSSEPHSAGVSGAGASGSGSGSGSGGGSGGGGGGSGGGNGSSSSGSTSHSNNNNSNSRSNGGGGGSGDGSGSHDNKTASGTTGKSYAFSVNAPPFNPAASMYPSGYVIRDIRDMIDYDTHAMALSARAAPWMVPQTYMPMPGAMMAPLFAPGVPGSMFGKPMAPSPQLIPGGGGVATAGSSADVSGPSTAMMSGKVSGRGVLGGGGGGGSAVTAPAGAKTTSAAATATATATASSSSSRRNGTGTDKESFSVYAKPWSPQPDAADDATPGKRTVDIDLPLWMPATSCGKSGFAPVPLVSNDVNANPFMHSLTIVPRTRTDIELKLYYYMCARCSLKTLYTRLTSRKPDVTLYNVAADVPPMCIAHLIDEVAGARVAALHIADVDSFVYDVWLDKPNMSVQVVSALSGALWTCPMFHGYAVYTETDEARLFLLDYLNKFKTTQRYAQSLYPMTLIEAKEHV